ncbi:MAG: hypothetical protein DIU69_07050, partial [Bacillota bacterium]
MRPWSWRQLMDILRFLRDPAAGPVARWAAVFALLYLIWPLDLLPGLPPFSWVDDVTVLWLVYQFLGALLERHRSVAGGAGRARRAGRPGRSRPARGGGAGGAAGGGGGGGTNPRGGGGE